jgi:hypothetical protein
MSKDMTYMIDKLYEAQFEDRAAILVLPNAHERDVIKQLAQSPRWDGDLNSKYGRDELIAKGMAAQWNGLNFLTQYGYAVVDSLWSMYTVVKS